MEEETKKEETQKEEPKLNVVLEKPVDKMTATELREVAKNIPGIEGAHAMKKEELIPIVKAALGIKDEAPPKEAGKKGAKGRAQVKARIRELRQEKGRAQEAKDRKKTKILRRRINRMKKLSRNIREV